MVLRPQVEFVGFLLVTGSLAALLFASVFELDSIRIEVKPVAVVPSVTLSPTLFPTATPSATPVLIVPKATRFVPVAPTSILK